MRYRWDPAYPMGRRPDDVPDARLRASDTERNEVADKLSRHFAEGRLDQAEFKTRLDTAMSATTRGDLSGLFNDLPRLATEPPPPPPRSRRLLPFIVIVAFVAIAAGATWSMVPTVHVPWLLIAVIGIFVWHRASHRNRRRHHHHHALEA
jgi:Flp pilus assembly protein TadB